MKAPPRRRFHQPPAGELAEGRQHGLPRIATVQNVYCLVSRFLENGLDETMKRLDVSLRPFSRKRLTRQ